MILLLLGLILGLSLHWTDGKDDGSVLPGLPGLESDEESTDMTVVPPKPTQPGCYNSGQFYANGADIVTEDPCEHCYCLNGDVVCAIQECMGPLEGKTDNCQALPPPPGQCCPAEYKCNPVTTLPPLTEQPQTVASVTEPELSTVMPTMTPTEEEKIQEGTENSNAETTEANDGIAGDETTQKSQETSTSEIQDSEGGTELSTEIPEEIESTSVGPLDLMDKSFLIWPASSEDTFVSVDPSFTLILVPSTDDLTSSNTTEEEEFDKEKFIFRQSWCGNNFTVSIESKLYPGKFWRHHDFILKLHGNEENDLYKNDTCFKIVQAECEDGFFALQSVNFPDRFIHKCGSKLALQKQEDSCGDVNNKCWGNTSSESGGLPRSVFPGIDSESVCSQQTCDPTISKLYKNSSLIESENMLKIARINTANKQKEFSWVAGGNSFISLSLSEVEAYRLGEIPPNREERRQTPERNQARRQFLTSVERNSVDRVNLPSSLEVFTTDASNQGECSACSAFAVTAALETCVQKVIPNPAFTFSPPRGLSSQNILDCAFGSPGLFGCDGGQSFRYLAWLEDRTLDTNRQYPYLDSTLKFEGLNNNYRTCYQSSVRPVVVLEESHSSWDDHTESDLVNILLDGHAIITTMEVQEDLMFYKSGVYQSPQCLNWSLGGGRDFQWEEGSGFRQLRHSVVIVGFGEEQGRKYWKVKNSWGENWGSSGFFKIIRNGSAHCGLGAYFSVALCKECRSGNDCTAGIGLAQPAQRAPPNLPEEGIALGVTSHLASPLGGVGLATCSNCTNLSICPRLQPCRTKSERGEDKCCRVFGGSGYRLYCPSRC